MSALSPPLRAARRRLRDVAGRCRQLNAPWRRLPVSRWHLTEILRSVTPRTEVMTCDLVAADAGRGITPTSRQVLLKA